MNFFKSKKTPFDNFFFFSHKSRLNLNYPFIERNSSGNGGCMIEKHGSSVESFQLVGDDKDICIGAGKKNKDAYDDKDNLMISLYGGTVFNCGQKSQYPEAKLFNKSGKIWTVHVE